TRYYLAKAYLQAGRVEDAITELKNTIDDPHAPMASRDLLESILLKSSGRKEALRRFYEDTIAKFQDSATWYNRAAAFAIAEGQFGRAEQLYQQAWQKDSKDVKESRTALDGYLRALILGAGTPNTASWNPVKLEKVFEEGRLYVDGDFSPIVFYRMAEGKMKLGDKATAVEYCRKALAKAFGQTDEVLASRILQDSYSLLGVEEVSKCCEETLEENPDSLAANFAMFSLMKITGEYNKAIGCIDKCLRIAGPDSPRRVDYMAKKAEVLELAYAKTSDNGYLEKAIKQYESLLAKMPNNTVVLNNLAYMLAKNSERLPEALEFATRAREAMPNNAGILDTYAYVLHKNGRYSEADESLQAALQQYEQSEVFVPADIYEHLGMIKEALGAKVEAIAAYKQALDVGADTLSEPAKEQIRAAVERLSQQGGRNN
ncbi:MAG: tetratricopeptide repeat protein, partial [Planctomycetota bacterium]